MEINVEVDTNAPSSNLACAGIKLISELPEQITVRSPFETQQVQVVDYQGRPLPDKTVTVQTASGIPMKSDMFDDRMASFGAYLDTTYSTANETGIAGFYGLYVEGAYNASATIVFVGGTHNASGFFPECQSQKYVVQVLNPVRDTTLFYGNSSDSNTFTVVPADTVLDLHVQLTLFSNATVPSNLLAELYVNAESAFEGIALPPGSISPFFSGSGEQFLDLHSVGVANFFAYRSPVNCDLTGLCSFGNVAVSSRNPGAYILVARVGGIISNTISIFVNSPVASIQVIVPPGGQNSTNEVAIGEPFAVQPVISVLDSNGAPVSGMKVGAIAVDANNVTTIGLLLASGGTPAIAYSGANGTVAFDGLYFTSGPTGIYRVLFYHEYSTTDIISAVTPMQVINNVDKVFVLIAPPTTAAFGVPFASASSVLVTDKNGYPIANKVIQAVLPAAYLASAVLGGQTTAVTSSEGIAIFSNLMFASGYFGSYQIVFSAAGILSDLVPVYVTDQPAKLQVVKVLQVNETLYVRQVVLVEVLATILSGSVLSTVRVDAVIVDGPNNGKLDMSEVTAMTDANGIASFELLFVAGQPGTYEIQFESGGISSDAIAIEVRNEVAKIEFSAIKEFTIGNPMKAITDSISPQISAFDSNGMALSGRDITIVAYFSDASASQGSVLEFDAIPVTNTEGKYQFQSISFSGAAISGYYQLQFVVDGVGSELSPQFYVSNPAQPSVDQLGLHEAQNYLLLILLCVIPLFLGNSSVQPAWQLIVSIPFLAILLVLEVISVVKDLAKYSNTFHYGPIFITQAAVFLACAAIVLVMYFVVCFRTIQGRLNKKKLDFRQNKVKQQQRYVKNLMPFGSKRFEEKVKREKEEAIQKMRNEQTQFETIQKEKIERLREAERKQKLTWYAWFREGVIDFFHHTWMEIKADVKHVKESFTHYDLSGISGIKRKWNGFYYPQRLWFGFALSLFTCFLTLLACIIVTKNTSRYLMKAHDKLQVAYQLDDELVSFQPQEIINRTLNGITSNYSIPSQISGLASQAGGDISQQIASQLPINTTLTFLHAAEHLSDLCKTWSHIVNVAGLVSSLVCFGIILVLWLFVFLKYKERALKLRRGEYFFDRQKVVITPAATYIGLQAIHSVVGYFMFWLSLTITISLFMYAPFRHYLSLQKGLLISFLLGLPFITKTITKFIISFWIIDHHNILHRRLWAFFDFVWIFVNLFAVIAMTGVRYIITLVAAIINFTRMDYPIFPYEDFNGYDFGYQAYVGMMFLDHHYNNPVFTTFSQSLISEMKEVRRLRKKAILQGSGELKAKDRFFGASVEDGQQLEEIKSNKMSNLRRRQLSSKWWMASLLTSNPQLLKYRKRKPSAEDIQREERRIQETPSSSWRV